VKHHAHVRDAIDAVNPGKYGCRLGSETPVVLLDSGRRGTPQIKESAIISIRRKGDPAGVPQNATVKRKGKGHHMDAFREGVQESGVERGVSLRVRREVSGRVAHHKDNEDGVPIL